jgi:hypothetical protein
MKKTIILISVSVILIISTIFFVLKVSAEDRYFNKVNLTTTNGNLINNNVFPTYYDTILSVGLEEEGIIGSFVVVSQLSDAAKEQFNGELKAHVRFFDGVYYLYTDHMDREEAIRVISHEIIHIHQYNSGQLIYENGEVTWENKTYDLNSVDYDYRPWEKDAFNRENELNNKILKILYD